MIAGGRAGHRLGAGRVLGVAGWSSRDHAVALAFPVSEKEARGGGGFSAEGRSGLRLPGSLAAQRGRAPRLAGQAGSLRAGVRDTGPRAGAVEVARGSLVWDLTGSGCVWIWAVRESVVGFDAKIFVLRGWSECWPKWAGLGDIG